MNNSNFTYNGEVYNVLLNDSDPSGKGCISEIVTRNEYNLDKFVNHTGTFIDIGANCGIATIIMAKQNPLSKVYSYEPGHNTYKLLQENVKLNGLTNVQIFNLAVSDSSDKTLELFQSPLCSGGNTTCSDVDAFENFYHKSITPVTVDCISFDDIISNNGIESVDLLKIDCEGAEFEILYNSETFKTGVVKKIVGEFHDLVYNTKAANKSLDLIEYCKQYVETIDVCILKL